MIKKSLKLIFVIFVLIFIFNFVGYFLEKTNTAVININGIINDSKAESWIEQINMVKNNPIYRGILIKINSPGGGANASEKVYRALRKADKTKPVVALIDSLGASGGYYIACGARKIVAYPTSITGSIGVIFESLNVSKLAEKIGISSFVIKSGKVKDAGNPFREPTQEDKKMLSSVIDGVYNEFLNSVSESRNIKIDTLKQYADGSVFSGKQALKIGLIDSVGGLDAAKKILKEEEKTDKIYFESIKDKKSFIKSVLGERVFNILYEIELIFTPNVKTYFSI